MIHFFTCHWCHVMEKESFEDSDVASFMNDNFVAIKVDREERPDVDSVYMTVCIQLTGHGGWPLTIIMTPEQKPFFAGTYFPKKSRYGIPGLMDVLKSVALQWKGEDSKKKLLESSESMLSQLKKNFVSESSKSQATGELLRNAYIQLDSSFDKVYGGFGEAPKFPTPHKIMFLLRYYKKYNDIEALHMAEKTLDSMYRGGIFDHIGFGFSRYSTDDKFLVPHFEKMLYDNALLIITYLEAYEVTKKTLYKEVASKSLEYVFRELRDENGGFYCAQDADSEGEEGKYYIFTPQEIYSVLGEEDGDYFCEYFDITSVGNFEGKNIPNLIDNDNYDLNEPVNYKHNDNLDDDDYLEGSKYTESDVNNYIINHEQDDMPHEFNENESNAENNEAKIDKERIESLSEKLLEYRSRRMDLHKDDKILTSWNGLMIAALGKAYKVLEDERYLDYGMQSVNFIFDKLMDENNRLLARFRDNESRHKGYLDDYAFLVYGLIELYESSFQVDFLKKAVKLNEDMINLFWDNENDGFYLYGNDSESLIARPKELFDGAIPSGNSVAAYNLIKLARLTGDANLEDISEKQLNFISGALLGQEVNHSFYLLAVSFAVNVTRELICVLKDGDSAESIKDMLREKQTFNLTTIIKTSENEAELEKLIPFTKDYKLVNDKSTYYLCEGGSCMAPVNDLKEIMSLLV